MRRSWVEVRDEVDFAIIDEMDSGIVSNARGRRDARPAERLGIASSRYRGSSQ
jgi:hypothetical protein